MLLIFIVIQESNSDPDNKNKCAMVLDFEPSIF